MVRLRTKGTAAVNAEQKRSKKLTVFILLRHPTHFILPVELQGIRRILREGKGFHDRTNMAVELDRDVGISCTVVDSFEDLTIDYATIALLL